MGHSAKRRRLEALLLCRFYLLVRVAAPVLRPHEFNVIVFLTPRLSVSISRVFSALSVQFARRWGSSHRASMLERGDGQIHGHTCGEPEQVLKHCVRAKSELSGQHARRQRQNGNGQASERTLQCVRALQGCYAWDIRQSGGGSRLFLSVASSASGSAPCSLPPSPHPIDYCTPPAGQDRVDESEFR